MAQLDPAPREGKMFGVLAVPGGYLRAFSGMLAGTWLVEGFAPPLFDLAARDAFWLHGEAELRARAAEIDAAAATAEALLARHAAELEALRERHRANRARRQSERIGLASDVMDAAARGAIAGMHALDQASRADTAERRALDARHAEE